MGGELHPQQNCHKLVDTVWRTLYHAGMDNVLNALQLTITNPQHLQVFQQQRELLAAVLAVNPRFRVYDFIESNPTPAQVRKLWAFVNEFNVSKYSA